MDFDMRASTTGQPMFREYGALALSARFARGTTVKHLRRG
jgi:hypothetical protein